MKYEFPWYCFESDRELYEKWAFHPIRKKDHTKWQLDEFTDFNDTVARLSKQCPAFLAHSYMSIRTKTGGIAPFNDWTPAQKKLYRSFMLTYRRGHEKPGRFIILKARQMGMSTLCEFLVFWRVYFFPFSKGLIATQEAKASDNLFTMLKLYYDCVPGDSDTVGWKWDTPINNSERILFDNLKAERPQDRVGSSVELITVGLGGTSRENQGKGHSQTVHILHASEVSRWQGASLFWGGVAQTIAKKPNTHVFIESTANGHGNFYHDFWQRAARGWAMRMRDGAMRWTKVDDSSRSSYEPCFFSWLEHPEYVEPLPEKPYKFRRSLDKRERKLVEHYGASLEQIQWRRTMLTDECGGDEGTFAEQYPADPDEAFVSSGRRVFDMAALQRQDNRIIAQEEAEKVALRGDYDLERSNDAWFPQWREDDFGPVRIWKKAQPGAQYVMGVDSCYGKEDGDFGCIQVLRKDNWEQVAQAHGRLDGDQLAHLTVALGTVYNDALAVIEVDGPGLHTLRVVQDLDYWQLYLRLAFDGVSKKPARVFGWAMSSKARQLMVGELKAAVREDALILNDQDTVREMREWMLTKTTHGKAKEMPADPNHGYDDRITSLGIALVGGIVQDGVGGALAHFEREERPNTEQKTVSTVLAEEQWAAALAGSTHDAGHPVLGACW